jgi:two-component system, chemotaxis family, protein-glutamate methylesterase/glutaminase
MFSPTQLPMTRSRRDIIVVGTSAGGVEALRRFVAALPADLPCAVFVVLHIWANGESFLPAILERSGPLPALHPQHGDPIEHGKIYVAPADHHLFVEENRIAVVRGPRENRFRPAINPLFRSAAASHGPRVIGVILTGTMDDGAAGLWAIKQCGGVTVVQDPKDAAFSEMPQSALDSVEVDHCLPLAEIPQLVARLAHDTVTLSANHKVPEIVRFNDQGAKMKQLDLAIDKLGLRSVFSCPECNGALWELNEGGQLSFRCHVGHGFSPKALREQQGTALEQSLWSALRALVESASLDERLAKRSAEHHLHKASKLYQQSAEAKRAHEQEIRKLLGSLSITSGESSPRAP